MEELEKWKAVNAAEDFDQLREVISNMGDIEYSTKIRTNEKVLVAFDLARTTLKDHTTVDYIAAQTLRLMTRNYGLRAKMMYLLVHGEK